MSLPKALTKVWYCFIFVVVAVAHYDRARAACSGSCQASADSIQSDNNGLLQTRTSIGIDVSGLPDSRYPEDVQASSEDANSALQTRASSSLDMASSKFPEPAGTSVAENDRPIIGILTVPMSISLMKALKWPAGSEGTFIPASYVKLVQSTGARVVPINYFAPRAELHHMVSKVNGLIIPGGNAPITEYGGSDDGSNRKWRKGVEAVYEAAMLENDRNNTFPIHATCLGFQALVLLTAQDDNVLSGAGAFAAEGVPLDMKLTKEARSSTLFTGLPEDLWQALAHERVAFHAHTNGISPKNFTAFKKLTQFWKVLSTSKDVKGNEFISTIEARKYPFSGSQWHPEKPGFEWVGSTVGHSAHAVAVGWHVSANFVGLARRNKNRFPSITAEDHAVSLLRSTVTDPRGSFSEIYVTEPADPKKEIADALMAFGESPLPSYSQDSPLGLPNSAWHPMALELEFEECQYTSDPIAQVLRAEGQHFSDPRDVALWLKGASARLNETLAVTPASDILVRDAERSKSSLRSLWVKQHHDDKDVLQSWNLEKEKTEANLLELASPIDMSEEETKFAVNVTYGLIGKFHGGQGSSSQAHVEARCLLSDDRLTGLLLLWEKYHDALQDFVQTRQRANEFAGSIALRNPRLLTALQERWESDAFLQEPLAKVFRRYGSDIVNLEGSRDGYRNFAINVCHLLHIDCCLNCTKNLTPKFGGIEFRLFNTEFGAPLRLVLQLMQRMVQRSCEMTVADLRKWTLNQGEKPATTVYPLFDLLALPHEDMNVGFLAGGAKKWQWYCAG